MRVAELDLVVLLHELPEHGLRPGDLGTVVHVYPDGSAEVEYVRAFGETQAVVELPSHAFRRVAGEDLLAVRTVDRGFKP